MASGIILGFFTGHIYGSTKPLAVPSKIIRLNYDLLRSFISNQGYNREAIINIYRSYKIIKNKNNNNNNNNNNNYNNNDNNNNNNNNNKNNRLKHNDMNMTFRRWN